MLGLHARSGCGAGEGRLIYTSCGSGAAEGDQALTLPSLKPQEQQCKKEEAAGHKDSKGHPPTWWGNPGAGLKGLFQRDVGDLAGVGGACRARFCYQGGGDGVGARCALSEAGEGGTRDWDRGSPRLLSGPCHSHIQRVIASSGSYFGGRCPCPGLTLDVELDDLLSSVQSGGDLANVGPLGGVPSHELLLRLQGSALPLGLPLLRGPAVYQLATALMLQAPLHAGEIQAWGQGEATVQGG
uniref:Uncharacterized protein n=1 Tax=Equus asinus TaxID=9793 RepID=A0A9L0J140_EQUAS